MIDLHCHILPGIDDGPATFDESLALARVAAADGTRTIVATPHVSWTYPNDADTIARLTAQLNQRLSEEEVPIEVVASAEIALTRAGEVDEEQLRKMRIGAGPWLLLEPPFAPVATGLETVVIDLQSNGHRVVLAHPERCAGLHRNPELLRALVDSGVLTSVTAGSLTGRFGGEVRRFALRMLEEGLVHNVASDAHDLLRRSPALASEIEQVGLGGIADWLTRAVPKAILSGEPIPESPAPPVDTVRARGRRRWLRRA